MGFNSGFKGLITVSLDRIIILAFGNAVKHSINQAHIQCHYFLGFSKGYFSKVFKPDLCTYIVSDHHKLLVTCLNAGLPTAPCIPECPTANYAKSNGG